MIGSAFIRSAALAGILVALCGFLNAHAAEAQDKFEPRSYLALPLDASGMPPDIPHVWELEAHGKHIVVVGTMHTRNPRSPMYDRLEAIFQRVRPQLVLNESTAPAFLEKMPRNQAIKVGAEVGFSVYLAGRYGAAIRSGDASDKEEFSALLAHYPAEDVLVFLTGQRLIGGRNPDLKEIARQYPGFYGTYLAANGIPLRNGWETWNGFLREYEHVVGRPLTQASWNPDLLSPVRNNGKLSEMCRTMDAFRDRHLLAAIRESLRDHDRVVVVFGAWHVLALEPVLATVLSP